MVTREEQAEDVFVGIQEIRMIVCYGTAIIIMIVVGEYWLLWRLHYRKHWGPFWKWLPQFLRSIKPPPGIFG